MEGFDWTVPPGHVYYPDIGDENCQNIGSGFYVTPAGVTVKLLDNGIIVEMTGDGSVRLSDTTRDMSVVLGKNQFVAGFKHPTGCFIRPFDQKIEVMTFDPRSDHGLDRFVRFMPHTVWFKERNNSLSFQVLKRHIVTLPSNDFFNLEFDFTTPMMYHKCDRGVNYYLKDSKILRRYQSWVKEGGTFWKIRNILILQKPDGKVRVSRNNFRDTICMDPVLGKLALTTPNLHATASTGVQPHFFLRRGNQRVFYDGNILWCRMARNALGINRFNKLVQQPDNA